MPTKARASSSFTAQGEEESARDDPRTNEPEGDNGTGPVADEGVLGVVVAGVAPVLLA